MTAAALTPSKEYIENGVTLAYAVPFRFRAATHIKAQRISAAGVVTELAYGTDYSVTGGETDAGGTLTVSVAGAAGTRLRIRRETPRSQDMDYTTGDNFPAESHEAALDKAMLIDQEQDQRIDDIAVRSILVPDAQVAPAADLSGLIEGDILQYRGGKLQRLDRAAFAGKYYAGDGTGGLVPASGTTGADGALRNDLADPSAGSLLVVWRGASPSAVSRTLSDKIADLAYNLKDEGAANDGSEPANAALSATIDAAENSNNRTVSAREGTYQLTAAAIIHQGVAVVGPGSQGSTLGKGLSFDINHDGDAFVWDGNGDAAAGTGGGLRNALVVKRTARNGGAAIKLTSVDDDHRPGEMMFFNVLSYAAGTGSFEYGLRIDGSANDTAGTRGIRSIYLIKFRVAGTTIAAVAITQATHFFAFGLQVDSGTGDDIVFSGKNENIFLYGVDSVGGITSPARNAANYLNHFHFSGKLGAPAVLNDNATEGVFQCSFDTSGLFVLTNKSKFLKCITNINPDFRLALATSTANDKTGDGTIFQVAFDTIVRDRGNNHTVPTNTYTCFCAGTHQLNARVTLANLAAGHTIGELNINRTGSVVETVTHAFDPSKLFRAGGIYTFEISELMELEHGDVVSITVAITGGTKTVGILGGYTSFSGKYLP